MLPGANNTQVRNRKYKNSIGSQNYLPTSNIVFSIFDSTNILCNKEDANATSKATAKAGAYGGAELGSAVGNSICCCCGGIIGNCIGEKYGERAVNRSGLQERAGKVRIV